MLIRRKMTSSLARPLKPLDRPLKPAAVRVAESCGGAAALIHSHAEPQNQLITSGDETTVKLEGFHLTFDATKAKKRTESLRR